MLDAHRAGLGFGVNIMCGDGNCMPASVYCGVGKNPSGASAKVCSVKISAESVNCLKGNVVPRIWSSAESYSFPITLRSMSRTSHFETASFDIRELNTWYKPTDGMMRYSPNKKRIDVYFALSARRGGVGGWEL